jgi:ParB family chromosome partitioning protein
MMLNPVRATVALSAIEGISPYNPRFGEPADDGIDALAASIGASGLLQPLLCEEMTGEGYRVLDGRRRYLALRQLSPDGSRRVPIEICADGAEDVMRETALALNVMRADLHPVAEYEAFADLEASGRDIAAIATAFGTTPRRVRRALKLARLAPALRAAWRAGVIDAEAAEAYATGETHEAQIAVFDSLKARNLQNADYSVRKALIADWIAANDDEALYVGDADYLAAGGRIEDSLFAEEIVWLDGTLAKKLALEKLAREAGDAAFEEGWGFVVPQAERRDYQQSQFEPDYLEDEDSERATLRAEAEDNDDDARAAAIDARLDVIEAKAILRAIPQTARAILGICATIQDGRLSIERGLQRKAAFVSREPAGDIGDRVSAPTSSGKTPKAEPEAPEEPGKNLRQMLDEVATKAFRSAIMARPDIALAIAIAALVKRDYDSRGFVLLDSTQTDLSGTSNELLARLFSMRPYRFKTALAITGAVPLVDLVAAFGELIAASIYPAGATSMSEIDPLAAGIQARAGALGADLLQHFDPSLYFGLAAKAASVAAIEAMDGQAAGIAAKKLKREAAAEAAATLARDRQWLPQPFARWADLPAGPEAPVAAAPGPTLAEAMLDAIEADEAILAASEAAE